MKKWLPQFGLLALSIIPVIAGAFRLHDVVSAPNMTPENARYLLSPAPIIIHIVSSLVFAVLGAFQFAPSLRRGRDAWHKKAGQFLMPAGFGVALSGLWMTAFYAWPIGDGVALYLIRWAVGLYMLITLTFGVMHLRARAFPLHGNWMLRAYAVAMGAGTQVLTHLPWAFLASNPPTETPRAIMMGAGWLINILFAEWLINKKQRTLRLSLKPV